MAAAASSTATPLTKSEIVEAYAKLEQLRLDMAARSAGGKQSGITEVW